MASVIDAHLEPNSRDNPFRRLMSAHEVAEWLQCAPSTVYQLAALGDLASIKIGRSVRFDGRDVRQFIDARRRS